jgi:predicted transposase YbfD/YdcC
MSESFVEKVGRHFETVTDPRVNRGHNYPLVEMMFVALCGAICDCNTWTDVAEFGEAKLPWFRKFFPFERGVPSHDTFTETFARLDTVEFYAALDSWARDLSRSLQGQTVAMDGKTLRGSHDREAEQSPLHSVSAWACGLRMCIGLKSVDDKSNEIPAVQQLVDLLDLKGAVVTADAMHCQRATVTKIVAKEADFVLMVKDNQESLADELKQALANAFEQNDRNLRRHRTNETNRGRIETREVAAIPVPKDASVFRRWPSVKTIGGVYRSREVDGKLGESQSFFISSLPCRVQAISRHIRSHWGIENSQHHLLDVTFSEDASRIRRGTGPEITSVFRRLALNILQQDTSRKASIRVKRKRCGWDETAFEALLAGIAER